MKYAFTLADGIWAKCIVRNKLILADFFTEECEGNNTGKAHGTFFIDRFVLP
jgi:hypothetical protein